MYGFEDSEMNYFNKFIEITCSEDRNRNIVVEMTKLKRENETLYRKCANCQRMVEDYAERCLRMDEHKPQITKQNFKDLLSSAQKISQL